MNKRYIISLVFIFLFFLKGKGQNDYYMHIYGHDTLTINVNTIDSVTFDSKWTVCNNDGYNSFKVDKLSSLYGMFPNMEIIRDEYSTRDNGNVICKLNLPDYDVLHVYFEYQLLKPLSFEDSIHVATIFSASKHGLSAAIRPRPLDVLEGSFLASKSEVGIYSGDICVSSHEYYGHKYKSFQGLSAFYVKYTGDVSLVSNRDIALVFDDNKIVVKHTTTNNIIHSIDYKQTDKISTIVSRLSTFDDIECKLCYSQQAGKECKDILTCIGLEIPLVNKYATTDKTEYWDAGEVFIPFVYDDTWHSMEVIIDKKARKNYAAFDGLTLECELNDTQIKSNEIEIGGYYDKCISKLKFRNISIDIDSYGDAEVIQFSNGYSSYIPQLISDNNPKLLLFEGHGIIDCSEEEGAAMQDGNGMTTSTGRLRLIFEELRNKGYKPVTWEDIVLWKIQGTKLPKRCYTAMFDDYRLDNYIDDDKRAPFDEYDVKPGLAIISDLKDRSDSVLINDNMVNVGDAIDMIMAGDWYATSHTSTHTDISDIRISRLNLTLQNWIKSCEDLGIYSDILVFPYGTYNTNHTALLENSGFKLGVQIVQPEYNCLANNNMYMVRTELGHRWALERIMNTIK